MSIKITDIELFEEEIDRKVITIMPYLYDSNNTNTYTSPVLSFWKYAKGKIDIEFYSEPKILIEQRSGDWFGPTILLTSSMLMGNSDLVSIYFNLVSSYLYDFFKGVKNKPQVKLKVICKTNKASKTTEISYEGDIEGIKELESSIIKIIDQGK